MTATCTLKMFRVSPLLTVTTAQMDDWEERDKSWKKFRKGAEPAKSSKLAKRLGLAK